MPEMAGGNLPRANNPWQCQLWVARALGMPGIPGSANSGWRRPSGCQESLAVPELGGEHPPHARKPWQCQPWLESRYASPSYVGNCVCKISY